jgi:hypothetical protein
MLVKGLIIIFLIIIPIIELYITEMNKNSEILCDSKIDIGFYEWSVVKNAFTLVTTILLCIYMSLNTYSIIRFHTRNLVYMMNFNMIIWIIIGLVLIFKDCEYELSDGTILFNILNILFGIISIYVCYYIIYVSFNYERIPLLETVEYVL